MNLYFISQTINNDWDTYDSAVVACDTADEARNMHPGGEKGWECYWCRPEYVAVKLIGVAADNIERGVVCSSFNAG